MLDIYVANDPAYAGPVPPPRERQQLDGFWCNGSGPQNWHVIGVLVFGELYPQSVGRATSLYYPNPYVQNPMPSWTREITHAEYDCSTGKVHVVDGVPPCAFVPDHEPITDIQWEH